MPAPKLTEGAGYEYRAVTDPDTLHVLEEPFGEKENRGALDDTELLERKGSLVTSFVNAYYEQTNVPVVAVSASRGSSSLNGWLTKGLKEETADLPERGERLHEEKKKFCVSHLHGLVPGRGRCKSGDYGR